MVLKRHLHENDQLGLEEVPVQESKRQNTFATVVRDAMRGLSMQDFLAKFEPFLRRVVREEVERGILPYIHSFPRPSLNQIEASGSRSWQLYFRNKLPNTVFTGSRIEAVDNTPLQVVILNVNSRKIVTSGPLSSIKIEIHVLDGDFGSDEQEEWTEKEFDACIIREREGKKPLVIGNRAIMLKDGVGYLGDIIFTDNSSWIRSRKFRLGAKAVRSTGNEERIREARSGAFIVKDHRGELYKKHHPPSLGDEVWRLERIGKDGAFYNRLASKGINTVQDFLRLLVTDPSCLRNILGSGMSNRTWDTIIQHATSCTLDNKLYMYYSAGRLVGLLFNSIYKVVGATFDGQSYLSLDNLTTSQMYLVEDLKQQAYRNLNDMVEMDGSLVDVPLTPFPRLETVSSEGSSLHVQQPEIQIKHQDQPATQLGFNNLTNPLLYNLEDHGQLEDVAVMQGCHPMQLLSPAQKNSFNMRGSLTGYTNDGNEWVPGGTPGPAVLSEYFTGDDISQIQMPSWLPVTATWGQGTGLFLASSDETGAGFVSSFPDLSVITRSCKPKMGWFKLRAAIKWWISVKRDVAARRRKARLLQLGY